jgi:hypothetical protein
MGNFNTLMHTHTHACNNFSQGSDLFNILNFQLGGINVDVQVSEGNIFINLSAYETGLAPALIVNHTDYAVDFWEKVNQPAIK